MNEQLQYWEREDVESMYDKNILRLENELIKKHIRPGSKIFDVGCGEGESTVEFANIEGVNIDAVDFSEAQLKEASVLLNDRKGKVFLQKVNMLDNKDTDSLSTDYDVIISKRFLINILSWEDQKKVLNIFHRVLKPNGKLVLLEGSRQGAEQLNTFRRLFNLPEIPVKNHNLFLDDFLLEEFIMNNLGIRDKGYFYTLDEINGLGEYYFLTRGIRPYFERKLNWDCQFNNIASSVDLTLLMKQANLNMFSRLKLWVWCKIDAEYLREI